MTLLFSTMFAILPVLVLLSVNYLASHVIGTVFPAARSENIDRVKADMVLDENIVTCVRVIGTTVTVMWACFRDLMLHVPSNVFRHHVWSNTAHSIADADHWVRAILPKFVCVKEVFSSHTN